MVTLHEDQNYFLSHLAQFRRKL